MWKLGLSVVVGLCACDSSDVSRAFGARCDDRSECDERCLTGANFPGGLCSLSCERTAECSADTACVDREGGVCLARCKVAEDCSFLGTGWDCMETAPRQSGETIVKVCVGR